MTSKQAGRQAGRQASKQCNAMQCKPSETLLSWELARNMGTRYLTPCLKKSCRYANMQKLKKRAQKQKQKQAQARARHLVRLVEAGAPVQHVIRGPAITHHLRTASAEWCNTEQKTSFLRRTTHIWLMPSVSLTTSSMSSEAAAADKIINTTRKLS
jgi:hypothetical protein